MSGIGNIGIPRRHTTQKPRVGTRIDWEHLLTVGLVAAIPLNEGQATPRELVLGTPGVLLGGANAPSWSGPDLSFAAGTTSSVSYVNPSYVQLPAFTASCEIRLGSVGARDCCLSTRNLNGTGFEIFVTASGQIEFYFGTNAGGQVFDMISPLTYSAGARLAVSFVANSTAATGYITDLTAGTTTSVSTSYSASLPAGFSFCLGDDASTRSFGGTMRWATLHNRVLSFDDVRSLHKDPYALYAPLSITRFPRITLNPPGIPTGLMATNAPSPVLNWTRGAASTGTNILRSTTSGSGYAVIAPNVAGTTYTDSSAVAGQTYYYVVQGYNSQGTSGNSSQATAYTQPLAPVQLAGTSGNGQVTLNAGAATGGGTVTYNVYDGTTVGAEGAVAVVTGQTNPAALIVTGLTNGQKYFFFATAQNAAGESSHSNETGLIPSASAGSVSRRIYQGFA